MENPPWASKSNDVNQIHRNTLAGMQMIGSKVLVIPLVDNSSILNNKTEFQFLEFVANLQNKLDIFNCHPKKNKKLQHILLVLGY